MPESGPFGSVRGALSNECPYRDPLVLPHEGMLLGVGLSFFFF